VEKNMMDRIEALEAKLGYYNLLWQAYEGERPVEHLEELVKNHSAVSDRLAEKLHKVESLLAKAVKLIELSVELGRWELNPKFRDELIDFTTEIKGENK
jgi:hypothetical protein